MFVLIYYWFNEYYFAPFLNHTFSFYQTLQYTFCPSLFQYIFSYVLFHIIFMAFISV